MASVARTTDVAPAQFWRICVDTGGTFTDCLAIDPTGARHRAKALSAGAIRLRAREVGAGEVLALEGAPEGLDLTDWRVARPGHDGGGAVIAAWDAQRGEACFKGTASDDWSDGQLVDVSTGEPAPLIVARMVTRTGLREALPRMVMRLATTRGTNALLEGAVSRVALFVTRGFRDLLEIGDQRRPELFALDIRKRAQWHEAVFEAPGRIAATGEELIPLDGEAVRSAAREARRLGINAAAIALANAWVNASHEARVETILREEGFTHVTRSAEVAPMIGLLARARTAVVNAALSGVVAEYIGAIQAALPAGSTLEVMTSAGGMRPGRDFHPKDSLLSGPAAGVAGALASGGASGAQRIIAFDMGGTSTDVSRGDTRHGFEYTFRHEVGGAEILAPALAIESVAAGGGSICDVVDGVLRVGPRSAGAFPGPACYGAGGPLTITDVNLLLGRIDAARFTTPVDLSAAEEAFGAVCARAGVDARDAARRDALLQGFLDLANERMAGAIRRISARQGYDPADYTLVSFGGAGGQHACAVAERLGVRRILCPQDASLLSAVGLDVAAAERIVERQLLRPLDDSEAALGELFAEMVAQVTADLGAAPGETRRMVHLRFSGQEYAHPLDWAPGVDLRSEFRARCEQVFGHAPQGRGIEVESLRVIVRTTRVATTDAPRLEPARRKATASGTRTAHFGGKRREVSVYERAALAPGEVVTGPALVVEERTLIAVEESWEASADHAGAVVLTRVGAAEGAGRAAQPVMVRAELAASRLSSISEEMGETLRRTSISTNVKERLDYSCALLDPQGRLIVSAPHVPVHLGALGVCVRTVLESLGPLPQGSAVVTNHPGFGGSHLPDVTVIAPAHGAGGTLLGYVACRAHHAEIGGTRPGSMPPDARTLEEEGAVIPPLRIMHKGRAQWDEAHTALASGPHPTRAIEDNLADLAAQLAACRAAISLLRATAEEMGSVSIAEAMASLLRRAEIASGAGIAKLGPGFRGSAVELMEDATGADLAIRVAVAVDGNRLRIDFSGTSPEHAGNLNAPAAVTRSAVMYVVRLLIGGVDADLPLNEGLMTPVELTLPRGLLNPSFSGSTLPAVAAGNVETSQKVVNALLRALGLCADSQGTMNNTLFGNGRFGFYETVCGGVGAGPGFAGADATHSHMTNTAITDIEVIERRYPVRIERFEIRRGSGGAGAWRGGCGVVREYHFLEPVALSILTQNRVRGPRGARGGEDGASGQQRVILPNGNELPLAAIDAAELPAGARLVLETPGGGGWGNAATAARDSGTPTTPARR